jgi:hypothetical protein
MRISGIIELLQKIQKERGDIHFGVRGNWTPQIDSDPFPAIMPCKAMPERKDQFFITQELVKHGKPHFVEPYQSTLVNLPDVEVFFFM